MREGISMSTTNRRRFLASTSKFALGIVGGVTGMTTTALQCPEARGATDQDDITVSPDARIQGPFLILSTPFTATGAVDFGALAREARYVDWCGCPGMIWPQSGDSVDLLTTEEKLQGMEVLAQTSRQFRTSSLCLGVQGRDTAEMLDYARHAEQLAPVALISRPPDAGKNEADLRQYWGQLASVTKRPVFIQTTGGVSYRGPTPSLKLLIELAEKYPNFGYVKEESHPVIARTRALLAARPPIRRVFSARGGFGWLYELRLGSEGLITERAIYADVLTRIWELHQRGSDSAALKDAYSKFLLMINLNRTHPGSDLRGIQLYLWKKRGVFETMVSRHYGPNRTVPKSPIFSELQLNQDEIAEIEYRFEALKPYQKPGVPDLTS
jgi:dihydrodipicolinate synthase/N-acetylneuraminate lyase